MVFFSVVLFIFGIFLIQCAVKHHFFHVNFSLNSPAVRGKEVLYSFGLFLFSQLFLIPLLLFFFLQRDFLSSSSDWVKGWMRQGIILGGCFSVLLSLFLFPSKVRQDIWGLNSSLKSMREGVIALAWIFPFLISFNQILSWMNNYLFDTLPVDQAAVGAIKSILKYPGLFFSTAFLTCTAVPLTEELLFRGILQSWMKRYFQKGWLAIFLSSAVFAMFHFSPDQGASNIELLSSLFLLSVVMGMMYEKTQSLWTPIAFHGCFNLISLLFIYFQESAHA